MTTPPIRWVGVAIDCADAAPVARFYERLLGFDVGDYDPPRWAQLWDPAGGVHLNIQGEPSYEPPTWPERPGAQAKMLHFEVEVDDLEHSVAVAVDAGATEAPWQPPDRDPSRIRIMLTRRATRCASSSAASSGRRRPLPAVDRSQQQPLPAAAASAPTATGSDAAGVQQTDASPSPTTWLVSCSVSPVLTYHSQRAPSGSLTHVSTFEA